jgi:MFS family permease
MYINEVLVKGGHLSMNDHKELVHEYEFFRILLQIISNIAGIFIPILLYKEIGSISAVFTYAVVNYIGLWIGYVIMSFYVDKVGYVKAFKITFLGFLLSSILFFIMYEMIPEYYLAFAFIIGFAFGTYWTSSNTFILKELKGHDRGHLINEIQAMILFVKVIIPVVIGLLLVWTGRGEIIFILIGLVSILAIAVPWKYNKTSSSKINSDEITEILKNKDFPKLAGLNFVFDINRITYSVIFMIVPFIFLKNELNVGTLFSVVALISGVIAHLMRNTDIKKKISMGYITFLMDSLSRLLLGFSWSPQSLLLREVSGSINSGVGDTAFGDVEMRYRDAVLGKSRNESAMEMNLIIETIYLFSRIIAIGILLFLLDLFSNNETEVLQIIVGGLSFVSFIIYFLHNRFYLKVKSAENI